MSQPPRRNVMLGIGFKLASVTVLLLMATSIKAAKGVPVGEIVFFRSFFAILPILVFLGWRGELGIAFRTSRPLAHLVRGVIGVSAMSLVFLALTNLPLPEATTLHYTVPLLLVALSAVVLKEQVGVYRWSAVAIGMTGILIIIWPRLTLFTSGEPLAAGQTLGVIAALCGAVLASIATLTVRSLIRTEASATIVFYFSMTASVLALLTLPFGWIWLTPAETALLIGAGIAGGIGQVLMTESYRHADMSVVAPFDYTSMVLAIALGYFVFGEVPTLNMLIGGVIVVAAGVFIIWRERQLRLERSPAGKGAIP